MVRDQTLRQAVAPNRQLFVMRNDGMYPTRVEAVDEEHFDIAAPLEGAAPLVFRPGDLIEIWIPMPTGLVRFVAPVLCRRVEAVPLLRVGWPGSYERYQRRQFVRVPERLPVELVLRWHGGSRGARYGAQTRDVSGGGVQVQIVGLDAHLVAANQQVAIRIDLGDGRGPVEAEGRVVRTREAANGRGAEIAIAFEQISNRDRDRLCRHINNRQIELRRKGLL